MNEKGRRAQQILDDPVFREAESMAVQVVKDEWEHEKSEARRDALWHSIQGANPLRVALMKLAGDYAFAEHSDRKKVRKLSV